MDDVKDMTVALQQFEFSLLEKLVVGRCEIINACVTQKDYEALIRHSRLLQNDVRNLVNVIEDLSQGKVYD